MDWSVISHRNKEKETKAKTQRSVWWEDLTWVIWVICRGHTGPMKLITVPVSTAAQRKHHNSRETEPETDPTVSEHFLNVFVYLLIFQNQDIYVTNTFFGSYAKLLFGPSYTVLLCPTKTPNHCSVCFKTVLTLWLYTASFINLTYSHVSWKGSISCINQQITAACLIW